MMTPIYHQWVSEINTKITEESIQVARKYHIEVNEEGLIQALTNARKFYDEGYADGQRDAAMQTDNVVEVVHGEWVKDGDFLICLNCESEINIRNSLGVENRKNYCPNCGAKMDGDQK